MRPRQAATVNERFRPAFNLTLRMLAFALTSQGLRVLLLHERVFRTGVAGGILETFAKCGHDQRLFECRIIEIRQGFFRMLRGGHVSGSLVGRGERLQR